MREPKPFYRKSKRAWYLQLGKRQMSLGRDKATAWRRYHEIMAVNEPIQENTVTVETLFERYLDWVEENRKPATYEKICGYLSSFANFIGKQNKVVGLSGSDLSRWVEGQKTWNSTSRNDAIGCVIRCFNWAVERKHLKTNFVANVPDKPRRKRRQVTMSSEQWTEIRALVKDESFGDLLDFMWETGCRPIEARTIEARHINLKAGIVVFEHSESKGEHNERVIYLNDKAASICKRRIKSFPKGPIMRNTRGSKPWTKDAINCRMKRIRKKLGGIRLFAYAIRHSYATNGLMNGMDSITLAQLMGHADTSMLAKHYAHLSKNPEYLKLQAQRARE